MRIRPALLLVLLPLATACQRDLEVPPRGTAATIASFSPAAGYAGEWLVVTGTGFDADPASNLVQFAHASARAEAVSGGSLRLRVPAGAGTGRIAVATGGGISDPSAAEFAYRGLGELRAGAVTSEIPLLHEPYRVLASDVDTVLHSDLLVGLVRYGDPSFVAPAAVSVDAAPTATASFVWAEHTGGSDSTLVRDDFGRSVGSPVTRTIPATGWDARVVSLRSGGAFASDAVAVIRHVDSGYTVALHAVSDLAPLPAWPDPQSAGTPQPLPGIAELRACGDAGNGDLACVARQAGTGQPLTVARIRLTSAPSVMFLAPPAGELVDDAFLPDAPFCAEFSQHVVAVALTDGRIAAANVATDSAFQAPIDTLSRTPVRHLTCVGAFGPYIYPTVIASKTDDDLLLRVNPLVGRVLWTVPFTRPGATAVWAASGFVHVASGADNRVVLLDLEDGALKASRSFDVLPGRVDAPDSLLDLTAMQGAAWYEDANTPGVPMVEFPTSSPRGTIWMPITAKRGTGLYPHYVPSSAVAVAPGITGGYTLVLEDQAFDAFPLASTAQLGLDTPTSFVHAATGAGLETVEFDAGWNPVAHTVSNVAGDPRFTSLTRLSDGRIVASLRSSGAWTVRAWSADGTATAEAWTSPAGQIAASAVLDGALWAFYWGADGRLHAVGLDGALAETTSDVALDDAFYSILAVSPNGRTFVSWDFQPYSYDTSVVVWSAAAGFPRVATVPVQGQVAGVAFDGTGEKLFVVTRGPDRVLTVE